MNVVRESKENKQFYQKDTVLFVDEIHRFNRAQQDAFLPFVEDGTITLIGATTQNPSFDLNAPLLSRCKVFQLNSLETSDLETIAQRAVSEFTLHTFADDALKLIIEASNGDARFLINAIEMLVTMGKKITLKVAPKKAFSKNPFTTTPKATTITTRSRLLLKACVAVMLMQLCTILPG